MQPLVSPATGRSVGPAAFLRHVAVIMDGNGRWASKRGLPRTSGHLRGILAVRRLARAALKERIAYLTLFAFSTENWRRERREVELIMSLIERYLRREAEALAREGVALRVIGDRGSRNTSLNAAADFAESLAPSEPRMTLTLAVSYGGQDDIVRGASQFAVECRNGTQRPESLDGALFGRFLPGGFLPPVDLLIRTGGELRISNFLLWHLAYAELVFLPTLWPDFTSEDLRHCLHEFAGRNRRFGKESN